MYIDLTSLNESQKEAVENTEGPLLVLAGAGTGKTRVLTTRIAHILAQNLALPGQILSVTFTNKAAKEMIHRTQSLTNASIHWCGTFHSISAKILRQHAIRIGFSQHFTIIDTDDQIRLIKQILRDYNVDEKINPAKVLCYIIGRYKDKGWSPSRIPSTEIPSFCNNMVVTFYEEYQKRLKLLQAMDFGDLILNTIELLNANLDILEYYQRKFKYVLVDEYQDTNVSQYIWLRMLTQQHDNICCVGDDDQSIYGWRGAEVKNILRFEKDFPKAKIIRLEHNYRSTKSILDVASTIIANNRNRHSKTLYTNSAERELVKLNIFYDGKQEAREIVDEIDTKNKLHSIPLSNTAILVRAGYQTRAFEEALNYMKIPYRIIGGAKFYDRAEIRDMLAYMRIIQNKDDSLAFERIVNVPKRGIGESTINEIRKQSKENNIAMLEASVLAAEKSSIKGKVVTTILDFASKIAEWNAMLESSNASAVIERAFEESGYKGMLQSDNDDNAKERIGNVKELLRNLSEFTSLTEYLEHVSLVTDNDSNAEGNRVNILTMHAAKGLEFDLVFLPGWEEGIFPSPKSVTEEKDNTNNIEEERRLAYVAITRAKKYLYISYACNRNLFGAYQITENSRFIDELPKESYEILNNFSNQNRSYNNVKPLFLQNNAIEDKIDNQVVNDESANNRIKYGTVVIHNKFGKGRVLAKLDGGIVQVIFDSCGFKKISLDFLDVV